MLKSIVQFDAEKLVINDESLTAKYNSVYDEFYIPPQEDDTFDPESMLTDAYINSRNQVGFHHPIEVAIWEDDPNKNKKDSEFRVHLRIIDGRHRWQQSIKHGLHWPTKFYQITSYNQYMMLRSHFDMKKDTNPNERIKFFDHLCKYYEEVLHIPKPKICAEICKDYSPTPFHEATIRRYVSDTYKNPQFQKGNLASQKIRGKDSIAEIIKKKPMQIRNEYAKLRYDLTSMYRDNQYLRSQLGINYFSGTRFIVEVKNPKHPNIYNFVKTFENEKDAVAFIKASNEPSRLIEQRIIRDIINKYGNKQVVKIEHELKSPHQFEPQNPKNKSNIIIITKNLFGRYRISELACRKCEEKILLGQSVISHGLNRSTKHHYYCLPCGEKLGLL